MYKSRTSSECPVCLSLKCLRVGEKLSLFNQKKYTYHRCNACNFMWVLPFPGYEVYNEAYYRGEGPDPFLDYENEYNNYKNTRRVIEFDDILALAEKNLRPRKGQKTVRWLDFGCGAGGLLKFLRDRGTVKVGGSQYSLEICGYDIGVYADRLRSIDKFNILTDSKFPDFYGQFDIITCIEVAEHVAEVGDLFSNLAKLTRSNGGLLLLTTGNLTSFAARTAGMNYRYLMPEIHISLFNPPVLTKLYEANGMQPLFVKYSGVVAYKVVKSIKSPIINKFAEILLKFPLIVKVIDWLYGVSAMPCAVKTAR